MTTWNEHLAEALKGSYRNPVADPGPVIAKAPDDESVWNTEFDDGYGGSEGHDVLAWTPTRVYFPVVYDGAEWLDSAPRDPQPDGQPHVGGQ